MADPRASDLALDKTLARAAQGDEAAWRALVEAYSKRVYALILRQCGDRELSEEITQATFVKIVVQIGKYQEQGKFEPWLFRIAMNGFRDEMRRRKRQARPMDMTGSREDEQNPWSAAEDKILDRTGAGGGFGALGGVSEGSQIQEGAVGGDPLAQVSHAEQVQRLRQAVERLGPADREILALRHTAGLSFAQIAQTLGQPLGTVLARGHRALGKLRKLLEQETSS